MKKNFVFKSINILFVSKFFNLKENPENFESKTIRCKDEDDEDENQSEMVCFI